MFGWIINVHDNTQDRLVESKQPPCFELSDGTPIFEVWIWHRELHRWFVMSRQSDPKMAAQGVVYFEPGDIAGLKRKVAALEGMRR